MSTTNSALYGGIEGGGSNTVAVILNHQGQEIGRAKGAGSNPWLIGIEACAHLLLQLVHDAKKQANVDLSTPLMSLGMCMSGMQQPENRSLLIEAMKKADPHLSHDYLINNDSVGSIFTASSNGGLVVISGTGSIAQLITTDGTEYRCGGWGHMLGDEGGAYNIASRFLHETFHIRDQNGVFDPSKPMPSIERAQELICTHFNVSSIDDILPYFYRDFSKSKVASLTEKISHCARNGDILSQQMFEEAGKQLGGMVRTLAPHLLDSNQTNVSSHTDDLGTHQHIHNVRIVCVGSVWKSIDLLWDSFVQAATLPSNVKAEPHVPQQERIANYNGPVIRSMQLVSVKDTSAYGAAWLGASKTGVFIPLPHDKLCSTLRDWEYKL